MDLHPATLWEAITDVVPDRLAVVQGDRRFTWREFDDRSARLAGTLRAHGVGAGAKVGQLLYNSVEFLESYYAALKIRAVPFNVNYRYTGEEVAYLLSNADADVLFFHSSLGGVVADALATVRTVEAADRGSRRRRPSRAERSRTPSGACSRLNRLHRIARDGNDITMIYTGGTTGMPKGVVSKVGPTLTGLLETVPPLVGRARSRPRRGPIVHGRTRRGARLAAGVLR